jgi:hypothetical protein
MYRLIIIAIILLTIPVFAQDPCGDLNCNGWCFEIGDFVLAARIIGQRCDFDSLQQCTLDQGDVDQDGYLITIADAMTLLYTVNAVPFPDFARHPESDTIKVESANAAPGDMLELPIYVKTIDTLTAFQISIETDPAYVTIDTCMVLDSLLFEFSYCSGHIYGCYFAWEVLEGDSITFLPGEYHIADLIVTVNPDIEEPVTTQIAFSNDPELLQYTAFSNLPFFTPVTVDGEIQITPTGIVDGESGNIPDKLSINAYPNPFNSNVNFEIFTDTKSELVIYDVLGRAIRKFPVAKGFNRISWDARDDVGADIHSGIYFARIENGVTRITEKILYLK